MKFKKILLTLGLVCAFSLAACNKTDTGTQQQGGSNSGAGSSDSGSGSGSGSQTQSIDYLSFVGKNQIRIDVLDTNIGANFNYGIDAISTTKTMNINSNSELGFSGTITADSVNFVFVVESGTESEFSCLVSVHGGLDNDYVETFLSRASIKNSYKNAYKVYIAISTGEVKWTKNLNAQLDTKIGTYLV
jgi:hypothetical protein